MELDFLVAGSHQVVDDVRRTRVAAGAAEPLVAGKALDNAAGVVDAAVSGQGVSTGNGKQCMQQTYAQA